MSEQRMCYLCNRRPAKVLGVKRGGREKEKVPVKEAIFCSKDCAAEIGLYRVQHGRDHWCPVKKTWSVACAATKADPCMFCQTEEYTKAKFPGLPSNLKIVPMPEQCDKYHPVSKVRCEKPRGHHDQHDYAGSVWQNLETP
jgi:hypothetical protein